MRPYEYRRCCTFRTSNWDINSRKQKNSPYCFEWPQNESEGDSWHRKDINRMSEKYFTWSFSYEKAFSRCELDAVFSNNRLKKATFRWFRAGTEAFQRNPNEFLRRFATMYETWIHYYTPCDPSLSIKPRRRGDGQGIVLNLNYSFVAWIRFVRLSGYVRWGREDKWLNDSFRGYE